MAITFTCEVVDLGKRWRCTDGTKTWYAGPDYKYNGKLASEAQADAEAGLTPTEPGVTPTEPPVITTPPITTEGEQGPLIRPRPQEGFVKEGGWGANKDPKTWVTTKMKDDPRLWKVIDDKGKNVATHFSNQLSAQYYIEYYQAVDRLEPDKEPEPEKPLEPVEPPKQPAGETPAPGTTVVGPYAATGKEYPTTKRRAVRHYASGAPDDETVELNAKNIKDRNHQFITYVTIKKMEHPDTYSQKIGGTHMGTGWFVNSIGIGAGDPGLCGIGAEKDHPKTSHNNVKGDKIGDIMGKKIGMASVYFADKNRVELWTDTGDGKWVKRCEGVNVANFNPKATTFECQLRIDGFPKGKDEPVLHVGVAQPIKEV